MRLNLRETRLSGLQMIEASAGTGKTWTIAALYLRLLLERTLPVEKILVVTYTNAATAELRARIRQRLLDARAAIVTGDFGADDVLSDVLSRVQPAHAQTLLTLALESFDLAAIHTIHGFCQRALAERAFESGLSFDSELASDDRRVLHEAAEDFWRRQIVAEEDPLWLGWLLDQLPGPDALLRQISAQLGKPYLLHVSAPPFDTGAIAHFNATFARVSQLWLRDCAAAMAMLKAHPGMNKRSHSPAHIDTLYPGMCQWLAAQPSLAMPKNAARLGASGLKVNKGHDTPQHVLFDALDELLLAMERVSAAFDARLGHLLEMALNEIDKGIRAARQRSATRSFDDLLLDLHAALMHESSDVLAQVLRLRYSAALIDEFQDTDPLQYEIFAKIFVEGATPLFFVGDPKQAIYSFRGADLRAYLDARHQAGEPLALDTNRRSTAALIGAVNALFSAQDNPFRDRELKFDAVQAPANAPAPILLDGQPLPALKLWLLTRGDEESRTLKSGEIKLNKIPKNRANPAIAAAVAASIAELLDASLQKRVIVDDKGRHRALEGRDIAVLVKSHQQGEQVRDALQALGVASVRYGQDSIFDTYDALEVERILLAIAQPGREGLVRSALATRLMGVRGDELAALDGDAWLSRFEDFHRWHVLARDHGFIRMWRSWQIEAGVAPRLLALPDGERLMTNLLHLSDLLAALAHDEKLGIAALAKHLADARNDARSEHNTGEGRLLRLESDENLVRIVTIHTAKGLEYPVTYCPFLWDSGKRRMERIVRPVRYHDPAQAQCAALDFGSAEFAEHHDLAIGEARAEAMRLAYVALTRARQHCVLVWGAMTDAEASPLAWLLHGEDEMDFSTTSDAMLRSRLTEWHARCSDIEIEDLPDGDAAALQTAGAKEVRLAARPWPARALLPWRMHSFSAWLLGSEERALEHDEFPEHDAIAIRDIVEENADLSPGAEIAAGLATFPAGANAGTCLHEIFERVSFTAPEAAIIAECLREFGFDATLQPAVAAMLENSLATPMATHLPPLRDIPRQQQIREMEFMLPVYAPDMQALAQAIGPDAGADGKLAQRVRSLQAAQLSGFLKGFIDLIFAHEDRYYVLDYKSNHLGPLLRDYAPAQLAVAMAEAMYDLQALLYGVALHLALQQRLPDYDYDRHCGGSLYLFLRGMQADVAGSGVYAWRPDKAMIERVASCLSARQKVFAC